VCVLRDPLSGQVRARVLHGTDGWYAVVLRAEDRLRVIGPLEKRAWALRSAAAQLDCDIRELEVSPM